MNEKRFSNCIRYGCTDTGIRFFDYNGYGSDPTKKTDLNNRTVGQGPDKPRKK